MTQDVELWVEGPDDAQAIASLLRRHQIDIKVKSKPSEVGEIKFAGSVEQLLEGMKVQISQRRTLPIGFVVDADSDPEKPGASIENRWRSIRDRLVALGLDCPVVPDPLGTVLEGVVNLIPCKVGIWLMPNNTDEGMLEHFLQDLIQHDDLLLPIAQESTAKAHSTDPRFPSIHLQKALIHTWLAWQKKPGQPYGLAIKAESFRHDSDTAMAFVTWFRQLYGV